jgi:large subunit ribosomal protein L28
MSKTCEICGKRAKSGNKISHSHRKSRRVWKPNIQKLTVEIDGKVKKVNICTTCLKSNRVKRPVKTYVPAEESVIV